MEYVECKKHHEGSQDCNRNVECVITSGEAKWCTGPKLKECYVYDPFIGNVNLSFLDFNRKSLNFPF